MITLKHHGDFNKTKNFLTHVKKAEFLKVLDKYGIEGVIALSSATPIDSGKTANSWSYKVNSLGSSFSILFSNSNVVDGVLIAIILQYGHATRNGGYIQGIDYINPAIKPVFDKIVEEAWQEVVNYE